MPRQLVAERFDFEAEIWPVLQQGAWAEWTRILSYGARRSSGFALAMNARRDGARMLVVTVSADGPITIMLGGSDPVISWPDK
jgi:hypothetical protein